MSSCFAVPVWRSRSAICKFINRASSTSALEFKVITDNCSNCGKGLWLLLAAPCILTFACLELAILRCLLLSWSTGLGLSESTPSVDDSPSEEEDAEEDSDRGMEDVLGRCDGVLK